MRKLSSAFRALGAASFLTVITVSAAAAQTQTAPAPDTKVTGDWGVHCFANAAVSPCEMQQTATQKKTGRRVMGVSIALVPKQNRYIFQVAVPLGVSLAKGVRIVATGYNGGAMAYRRCDNGGCYVEGVLDAKAVDALAAASAPSKIEIVSVAGKTVDLPFSLHGFAEARKDMEDRARAKAGTATPPPPAKPAAAPATDSDTTP